MIFRSLPIVVALLIFASCTNQPATKSGDVVGEFQARHIEICKAMEQGDIERAKQLSDDTNTWLEGLSVEEQTLISRTLTEQH